MDLKKSINSETLKQLKDVIMEDCKLELTYDDEDLNSILIKMIKSGKINAKIDMKKQIVVFDDKHTSIEALVKKLESQNDDIIQVLNEVENTDKELLLQKKAGIHDADGQDMPEFMDGMMFMDDV
mmetsp:Transcript_23765/g.23684  ORF Transcript_23765/g.23684 Transcript_23765/m.23684 type:complete len:125 (-) Transcript_23765:44-418(-)